MIKNKNLCRLLLIFAISVSINGCQPFYILTGCVKDTFTIKLVDQNIELVPDKFFSINDLHLTENNPISDAPSPNSFNSEGIKSYKITIQHNGKTYYGRLAFFAVPPSHSNEGVASYYKISIPEDKFGVAGSGLQCCWYEYWGKNPNHPNPTWVIWLSDVSI